MPEYMIAHVSIRSRPRANRMRPPAPRSSQGLARSDQAMGFAGTRRRFNPQDAIELSKVSMTNLSSASAATPCDMRSHDAG